ncbi:MAG TPA: four helix bundle protein [Ignavibacteria bacterium]|nr:four helix bundle protein [Ignavibacteria bacterium]
MKGNKMKDSIVKNKSYKFSLKIIKLYLYLKNEKKEYQLSKQILRSGTSICANIEEALGGQSRKDFLSKISISYKEARETNYWLRLLRDSQLLEESMFTELNSDSEELLRILGKIQITVKNSL